MLLFHEKCTHDVRAIINELRNKDSDYAKEFMQSLVLTYQDIYAKDYNQGQLWEYDFDTYKSIRVNIVGVKGFPYTVIFLQNSNERTIVLTVQYNRKSMTQMV
jgi:hypothetical protein